MLKIVRLLLDTTTEERKPRLHDTKNTEEEDDDDLDIQDDQPTVAADANKRRRLFTCVSEDGAGGSPEYVWVEGRLETRVTKAKDEKGRGYKCTLLPGASLNKVKKIEKKLKVMSKDLKRFSRTLRKFTAPV